MNTKSPNQETRDRIAAGIKKYWENKRKSTLPAKPKPQPKPDSLGFHMKDAEENFIIFPITGGIVPCVVFDFPNQSISIEVPGVLTLASGNMELKEMKAFAAILNRNYNHKKKERRKKKVSKYRKKKGSGKWLANQ